MASAIGPPIKVNNDTFKIKCGILLVYEWKLTLITLAVVEFWLNGHW